MLGNTFKFQSSIYSICYRGGPILLIHLVLVAGHHQEWAVEFSFAAVRTWPSSITWSSVTSNLITVIPYSLPFSHWTMRWKVFQVKLLLWCFHNFEGTVYFFNIFVNLGFIQRKQNFIWYCLSRMRHASFWILNFFSYVKNAAGY